MLTRSLLFMLQVTLVDRLLDITPSHLSRFFFCNSGAEAVDNAVKVARAATGRPNIIAFDVGLFCSSCHVQVLVVLCGCSWNQVFFTSHGSRSCTSMLKHPVCTDKSHDTGWCAAAQVLSCMQLCTKCQDSVHSACMK